MFSIAFEAIVAWGEVNGLIKENAEFSFLSCIPDGYGNEHEAWFDERSNLWFKATYANQFGLGWNATRGTATEYLNRLVLQNQHFGDKIELVALIQHDGKLRILTSQPHIAGEAASAAEIAAWFESLGFVRIESRNCVAWYLESKNLLVADAHEGNVVRSGNTLVPIDLNMAHPTGECLEWILEYLHPPIQANNNPL